MINKSCQKCNQLNPSGATFCLNCAAPLAQGQFGGGQRSNQPNYAGNSPVYFQRQAQTNEVSSRAKLTLGLGLTGLLCLGPLTSVPALIVGWMEISAINQGQASAAGKTITTFGIGLAMFALVLQIGAFFLWIVLALAISADGSNY